MKILTVYEELVGKTIAFSHMAQFADQVTLATTDGEVLMAKMNPMDDYGEDFEIEVMHPHRVLQVLDSHEWLRTELARVGAFDLEQYKKEQAEKFRIEKEKREKERVKRELETLAKLKEKYPES